VNVWLAGHRILESSERSVEARTLYAEVYLEVGVLLAATACKKIALCLGSALTDAPGSVGAEPSAPPVRPVVRTVANLEVIMGRGAQSAVRRTGDGRAGSLRSECLVPLDEVPGFVSMIALIAATATRYDDLGHDAT
jgi:hypothetical protein